MNDTPLSPYRNWRLLTDDHGVVWLAIDVAERSTNVLTEETLDELRLILAGLRRQPPRGLVIRSGKKSGFIAGADVASFGPIASREEALTLIRKGQEVFSELEALPCPTLCLIEGFCLGGGLELALACKDRIAADTPATKIGLPEVRLGIHPGFGGTVRLTRLIGAPAALPLMLAGKIVDARTAARIGIISHAVPDRLLVEAARQTLASPGRPRRPGLTAKLSGIPIFRPLVATVFRRQLAAKVRQSQYPAPYALIDLWKVHGGSPAAMMRAEGESVAELIRSPTSRNLVRAFFLQERLKSLAGDRSFQPRRVHVVGGGIMGGDIAAWCVLQGMQVSIQDNGHEVLARAMERARTFFTGKLRTPHLIRGAMDRLMPDLRGNQVGKADVVIEAIFENVEAKRELFRMLEPALKPDALLATNTSSIPLETLAEGLAGPERLVGLHFFNPVARMELVEVVGGRQTSAETLAKATRFTREIGKLPLPVASSPGFLVNRILMPYLHEAALLAAEGVPPVCIDAAAEEFGMPVGPIELLDMVGLDISIHVAEFMSHDPLYAMPESVRQLVAQGHVGRKSGRGYYLYRQGKPVKERAPRGYRPPDDLTDRLMLRLCNEAVACLREGVVADGDLLDAGMIFATGFAPFRGGVIHHIRSQAAHSVRERLVELAARYSDRFSPDPGLTDATLQ